MINETITGNASSATTNATAVTSEAAVTGAIRGVVLLECRAPNGNWRAINNETGAYAVVSPDVAVEYRFRCLNVDGDAHVYFGP